MNVKVCFAPQLNKTAIREETLKIALQNLEKANQKKEQMHLQTPEEPVEQVHTCTHSHTSVLGCGRDWVLFDTILGCVVRHCLSGSQ